LKIKTLLRNLRSSGSFLTSFAGYIFNKPFRDYWIGSIITSKINLQRGSGIALPLF